MDSQLAGQINNGCFCLTRTTSQRLSLNGSFSEILESALYQIQRRKLIKELNIHYKRNSELWRKIDIRSITRHTDYKYIITNIATSIDHQINQSNNSIIFIRNYQNQDLSNRLCI